MVKGGEKMKLGDSLPSEILAHLESKFGLSKLRVKAPEKDKNGLSKEAKSKINKELNKKWVN